MKAKGLEAQAKSFHVSRRLNVPFRQEDELSSMRVRFTPFTSFQHDSHDSHLDMGHPPCWDEDFWVREVSQVCKRQHQGREQNPAAAKGISTSKGREALALVVVLAYLAILSSQPQLGANRSDTGRLGLI